MSEFRAGTKGETPVSFETLLAVEHQQPLGSESVANGLGDALADPVEVGRGGVVGEGQNQDRFGAERAGKQHRKRDGPYHVHS